MNHNKQTILILGGFGFLGTNILKYIDENLYDQYSVIVLDRFNNHPEGINFHCVEKVYAGDFTDTLFLKKVFNNNIDIVIHSLSTTIPVSSRNARYDIETNLFPTLSILDIMVGSGIKNIVYMSSGGAIYGMCGENNHNEEENVYPVSSYGIVKLTIEKYLFQYAQLYEIEPLIIRLSNPYGPYHYSMRQGVVNVAMTKALKGERMTVWGKGEGMKDYIFVEDFVRILFALMQKSVKNEVINIASGQLLSVNKIISSIQALVPTFEVDYGDADNYDASYFSLDTTKLHKIIGEYTFCSFDEGLCKTLEWTKTIL